MKGFWKTLVDFLYDISITSRTKDEHKMLNSCPVSSVWVEGIDTVWKITQEKWQYSQRFWAIRSLHLNFLFQNVQIFPLHILLTKRIDTLWSEGISTVWVQKNNTKILNEITKILNYIKSLSVFLYVKLGQNFHFTHYLHTSQTIYILTTGLAQFMSLPTQTYFLT